MGDKSKLSYAKAKFSVWSPELGAAQNNSGLFLLIHILGVCSNTNEGLGLHYSYLMDRKCCLLETPVDRAAFLFYLPCNQDTGEGFNNCHFHVGPVM